MIALLAAICTVANSLYIDILVSLCGSKTSVESRQTRKIYFLEFDYGYDWTYWPELRKSAWISSMFPACVHVCVYYVLHI